MQLGIVAPGAARGLAGGALPNKTVSTPYSFIKL